MKPRYASAELYPVGTEKGPRDPAYVDDHVLISTGSGTLVAGFVESIDAEGRPRVLPCVPGRVEQISAALRYVPTTRETVESMPPNTWSFPPRRG